MKKHFILIISLLMSMLLWSCGEEAEEMPDWDITLTPVNEAYSGETATVEVKVSKAVEIQLLVDGSLVESTSGGSLVYDVSSLSVGNHTVKVSIDDGYGVYEKSFSCRIVAKSVMDNTNDKPNDNNPNDEKNNYNKPILNIANEVTKTFLCKTLEITATTDIDCEITLYIDGSALLSVNGKTLTYDLSDLQLGTHTVKFEAVNGDKKNEHSFELEVVENEIEHVELFVNDLDDFLTTKANNQTIYDVKIQDAAPNCDDIIKLLNKHEKIKIKLDLESCTELSNLVISDCEGLISLKTPHNITYLNVVCDALEELHFNCTSFNLVCPNLNSVVINQITPPKKHYYSYNDVYGNLKLNSYCKIYVPASAVETYKTANGWKDYVSQIMPIDFEIEGDEYSYVDLGLPSGTLWATCNVGAENPWDYGDYFAWGETEPHKDGYYSWDNYTYGDNPAMFDAQHDAATANLGSNWRMPTKEEFQELIDNCEIEWTFNYQGTRVAGHIVWDTYSHTTCIFLPASGYGNDHGSFGGGGYGLYWSSSFYADYPDRAFGFHFESGRAYQNDYIRCFGCSVRPVRCK